ncbi:hypothetical protein L596_021667 [Steinernema carpocapsae]|uniref:Peptidase M14 domain-containing protein n=1 Tax=Steinernema carpocapsae TaxID=34508 RepID=A0A4U5MJE9_STECR|nr:hypothetical protein L596_021667 [Steinernema carpocapsae]
MKAAEALKSLHGSHYDVGTSLEINNSTGGGISKDWAFDFGIPYSYTIELRPDNRPDELIPFCGLSHACGFLLNPKEIKATFEEFFAAFQVMAEHVTDEFNNALNAYKQQQ